MDIPTDLLKKLYQGETKREKSSPLSPEKARLIQQGLEKLVSYGLLNDPHAIRDWANGLVDLDERALVEGFRKAKDHTGYMSLGDLRGLCKVPMSHASHNLYLPEPSKKASKEAIERFRQERKLKTGI